MTRPARAETWRPTPHDPKESGVHQPFPRASGDETGDDFTVKENVPQKTHRRRRYDRRYVMQEHGAICSASVRDGRAGGAFLAARSPFTVENHFVPFVTTMLSKRLMNAGLLRVVVGVAAWFCPPQAGP